MHSFTNKTWMWDGSNIIELCNWPISEFQSTNCESFSFLLLCTFRCWVMQTSGPGGSGKHNELHWLCFCYLATANTNRNKGVASHETFPLLVVKFRFSREICPGADCSALLALGKGSGPFRAMFTEARHRLFVILRMCVLVCVCGGGENWKIVTSLFLLQFFSCFFSGLGQSQFLCFFYKILKMILEHFVPLD